MATTKSKKSGKKRILWMWSVDCTHVNVCQEEPAWNEICGGWDHIGAVSMFINDWYVSILLGGKPLPTGSDLFKLEWSLEVVDEFYWEDD